MFEIEEGLKLINVDMGYLKTLHEVCSEVRYRDKEYSFCLKIMDDVIDKANKVYEKQIKRGKVQKFCCDFKILEEICCTYEV